MRFLQALGCKAFFVLLLVLPCIDTDSTLPIRSINTHIEGWKASLQRTTGRMTCY